MVNIHEYLSAMKINWLRRIFQPDNCLVKNVLFAVCPAFANIRGFGGEYANTVHRQIQNPFWAQVLMHYKRFCAKCQPKCFTEFLSEHIHYNSHIVRDNNNNNKIHDRRLSENCMTMVKHLMDEEESILSFADFHKRFPNVGLDFLTYHGLVSSVMTYQKKNIYIVSENSALPLDSGSKPWSVILKRGSRGVYSIVNEYSQTPKSVCK